MVTSPALPTQEQPETILFRPSKKRKIYRQRERGDEDDAITTDSQTANEVPASGLETTREQSLQELISSGGVVESDEVEGTAVSMAEILRLRKRNKRLGVEFRVEGQRARDGESEERGLTLAQQGEGDPADVQVGGPRRFAPQTGTVGDVNKHM
jgi:hypothetical protein